MKSVLLAVGLSLLVTAVGVACIWELTRWNLSALKNVEPLSWDAVSLVWAYAFGFTAVVVLVLIAVAVLLWLAEVGRSATTPSSAAPPPS